MKPDYIIASFINYRFDKCIEVINDKFCNEVVNYGLSNIKAYNKSKDEDTVGVWKIKELKK